MSSTVRLSVRLAATAMGLALSAPGFAQSEAPPQANNVPGAEANEGFAETDIIVTARRRDESVQDVPLTVNAVTSEEIGKLNLRDFQDVQTAVPGLSLSTSQNATATQASIRGISNDVIASGNNGTIEFYLNDAPTQSNLVFQTMFDVAQIEILRGPQGTLRGRASPSGSVTLTTRRPDLAEVGGYINMTGTTRNAINVNGAVGVPIVTDMLAVRVAAAYEENDANQVRSINNGLNPFGQTQAIRASLRFDPIDNLSIDASYTKLIRNGRQFDQVESANLAVLGQASPVLIRPFDRLAVESVPVTFRQEFDVWNWRGEFRFGGHKLNYVGSFNKQRYNAADPSDRGDFFGAAFPFPIPAALIAPNRLILDTANTTSQQETHELRLSSDERLFGMVDYVIGGLINKANTNVATNNPFPSVPGFPLPVGSAASTLVQSTLERSLFGNVTLHLGQGTEVSGGVRYINYRESTNVTVNITGRPPGFISGPPQPKREAVIYSASLKHRFNENLMAYFSFGTSWRPGSSTNAIINRSNEVTSPRLASLLFPEPETSRSYEIGFKSDWMDRRLKLNVSAYLQDFENLIISAPDIYAIMTIGGVERAQRFFPGIAAAAPARVKGIEAELAWNTPRFSAAASISYAKSNIKNAPIPCNPYGGAIPTVAQIRAAAGGETIALCTVNYSASNLPPFSATLQSEYNLPISGKVDGYLRGLASIYGSSQNEPANAVDDVDAYALVNLYAGIRDPEGRWDVGLFVKNLFDAKRVLSRRGSPYDQQVLGIPSTYRGISTTAPREFGLNVRYSFGSR